MSDLARHIEITGDDVIVDGQSIGGWIKHGSVTIKPQGANELPQVTLTLIADRVTVNLDMDETRE